MLSPTVLALFDVMTELWNTGNPALLSHAYAADAVRQDSFAPEPARGLQQIGAFLAGVRAGFPDFHLDVKQRMGNDEWVATEWSTTGTHTGPFLGAPPTGKVVTLQGVTLDRIVDGKVVEERAYFDRLNLLQQLGLAPNAGSASAGAS